MHGVRKIIVWIFAFNAIVCFFIASRHIADRFHVSLSLHSLRPFVVPVVFSFLAIVFGMAWWTTWRERPFARAWGTVASLINFVIPLLRLIFFSRSNWNGAAIVIAVGIAGLIAFLWPNEERFATDDSELERDNT
jgi:hypothetical protein